MRPSAAAARVRPRDFRGGLAPTPLSAGPPPCGLAPCDSLVRFRSTIAMPNLQLRGSPRDDGSTERLQWYVSYGPELNPYLDGLVPVELDADWFPNELSSEGLGGT